MVRTMREGLNALMISVDVFASLISERAVFAVVSIVESCQRKCMIHVHQWQSWMLRGFLLAMRTSGAVWGDFGCVSSASLSDTDVGSAVSDDSCMHKGQGSLCMLGVCVHQLGMCCIHCTITCIVCMVIGFEAM